MTTSTLAASPDLQGRQRPRICSLPPYASTSGEEAVELAELAGLELDPWQQFVLTNALGESADWKCPACTFRAATHKRCPRHPAAALIHPWTAFEVGLTVARQNGKSEILVARMLAGAFLLGERLQIYSAHQFDTAIEVFHRLVAVIENAPELVRKVRLNRGKVGTYSHGSEGVTLQTGERIRFKARTAGGGRGFSCDNLMLDEAMILPESFLGATVPTLSARPNPQIWLAGSAVDQTVHEHGIVLAQRRERGIAGDDPTLAYFEWSAEGEDPEGMSAAELDDRVRWEEANPGLGIRISPQYVKGERVAMGSRNFAVERLGIGDWPDTSEEAGRVISRDAWGRCPEHDPANRIAGVPTFAVDANMDGTWGSVGIAGARADKLAQIAVVHHERGTDWIADACVALKSEYRRSRFVVDKRGPAAHLIPALKTAGIRVFEASTEDYGAACADFVAAVNEARVRYPFPQPELDDALANARKASLGDRWKWSRKDSASADISPIVAVTLAHWGHCQAPPKSRVVNLNDYV